jgi:hypothetical protein
MRRLLALTVGLCLALTIVMPAVAAPTSPFTGTWISHDPAPPTSDGSTLHLDIQGGMQARINFIDEYASVCFRAGLPTYYTARGKGTVSGDTLNATWQWAKCGNKKFTATPAVTYVYDDLETANPADDTLWDGRVVWTRD